MAKLYFVIGNAGDGSNFIEWTLSEKFLEWAERQADAGSESYGSGDGLQVHTLNFTDDLALRRFLDTNPYITLAEFENESFKEGKDVRF